MYILYISLFAGDPPSGAAAILTMRTYTLYYNYHVCVCIYIYTFIVRPFYGRPAHCTSRDSHRRVAVTGRRRSRSDRSLHTILHQTKKK